MAKKLFKNYTFTFDKNEKKIITNFCTKAISQMQSDEKFARDVRAFESIIEKLNEGTEEVKFTKDEKIRLVHQLKENTKFIKQKMDKSFILIRWLYKTMYNQYNNLLTKHFSD
ncbi:MAG: hypothetical protein GXO87_05570 [Chlorobi bacterium]|nr:hypothetical protein [Chlorobiota bacterium]